MLTLEQRLKRLERLIRMNESDSNIINLFREVNGKHTLIKTFTVDDITPQGVVNAIKKDAKLASYKNINDYLASGVFSRFYKAASNRLDDSDVGYYSRPLDDGEYCIYFLCVDSDIDNNVTLLINATLSITVSADYSNGDMSDYGSRYNDGWSINDEAEVHIHYDDVADYENNLTSDDDVSDKIYYTAADILKLSL